METVSFSCMGQSHLDKSIPCQDASGTLAEGDVSIAVVSDGHGSPVCFRSDIGSKAAVSSAMEKIGEFVKGNADSCFSSTPFTQISAGEIPGNDMGRAMVQLLSSIITSWCESVEKDSGEEYSDGLYDSYGCTLMGAVLAKDWWFAFHIGDGRILAIDRDGNVSEPVPWDPRCHDNVTTSMCGSEPLGDFRFCYGGTDTVPDAVFLCSDGLEDSYLEEGALGDFAKKSISLLKTRGENYVLELYTKLFPELSRDCNINRDDISVAFIVR